MTYGLPYLGSKNRIADFIVDTLPRGNRLVDLCGGGWSDNALCNVEIQISRIPL